MLRYGLTREWVAGLKVVTGRGELLVCNRGLVKNASGYDLRHLLIGSANFDHRSFRLNFELSMLVADAGLADAMETAWHDYTERALEILADASVSRLRRLGDAVARLLSPLL